MLKNDAYVTHELLYQNTAVSLGNHLEETFRRIPASRGNKHGYLRAIQVVISGSLTQASATAVLTKEEIWGLLDKLTIEGNRHVFCQAIPGEAVVIQNAVEETLRPDNLDEHVSADFANDTNAHTFVQSYLFAMAPKMFRAGAGGGKGEKDGLFPLAAMRDHGKVSIDIVGSLTSAWAITSQTYLSVKVILHTYYTSDVILPSPRRFDHFTSSDSEVQFPNRLRSIETLWSCDDAFDAYTLPAGNFRYEVDGETIQNTMTGAMQEFVNNRTREDSIDDLIDNQVLVVASPTTQASQFDCATGRLVKLADTNQSHSGANFYFLSGFLPPDPEQTAEWAALMGVRLDPKRDQSSLTVGRSRPGQGIPSDASRIAGASFRIER